MDDWTRRALYESRWTLYHGVLAAELLVACLLLALILWRLW